MKKILLLLFLVLMPVRGYAVATPIMITDPIRTLASIIITLLTDTQSPNMEAIMNVTQEEVDALLAGDEAYMEQAVDQGTGSGAPAVPTEAYDYVSESVLSSSKKTPYEPLNSKINAGGDMEQAVKELFFFESSEQNPLTEDKQKEIEAKRTAYLTTLAKSYVRTAYEVQQKVAENMDSIGADINADGTIGAVSGIDQTWKAINRTLIADIGLQIQLMELDAARFLSAQPVEIMSATKPEKKD